MGIQAGMLNAIGKLNWDNAISMATTPTADLLIIVL